MTDLTVPVFIGVIATAAALDRIPIVRDATERFVTWFAKPPLERDEAIRRSLRPPMPVRKRPRRWGVHPAGPRLVDWQRDVELAEVCAS